MGQTPLGVGTPRLCDTATVAHLRQEEALARTLLIIAAVLSGWLIQGCGGSGNDGFAGPGGAPTESTRKRVGGLLGGSAQAMAQSGVQSAGQADALGGGSSMAWIGGFLRTFAPGGMAAEKQRKARETDPVSGGGGFYFDDWLQLWVMATWTETTSKFDFYQDQEMARPAGHMAAKWPGADSEYPMSWSSDYRFDAGPMSGSHGTATGTATSLTAGSMEYDSVWVGTRYEGKSEWSAEASSWSSRSESAEGAWSKDGGEFRSDGSGVSHTRNSLGYATEYRWLATGAGTGTIEGPDPGLPAQVAWDASGKGTITYADGTVEEFSWWSTATSGTGGGTTGGGGGTDDGGSTGSGGSSGGTGGDSGR